MKKIVLVLTLLTCLFSANAFDMKAPSVYADNDGYISLSACPSSVQGISVKVDMDDEGKILADVFVDGRLNQRFDALTVSGAQDVHYLDANFDGFIDIFIGTGESRNYSVLLLWDNKSRQFVKVDNEMNGLLRLHPKSKSVILQGSSSWCTMYYSIYRFDGFTLRLSEELVNITDPSEYFPNGVRKAYTIIKSDSRDLAGFYNDVKMTTDDKRSLPRAWQSVLRVYGD